MSHHPASRLMHSQSPAQAMINGRIDGAVSIRTIQKKRIAGRAYPGYGTAKMCSLPYRHDQTWNAGHAILNLDPGRLHKQFAASVRHLN